MSEEIEVSNELEVEAPKAEWLEPSTVGGEYVRHAQAMRPCERVPVDKAFALAPGFNVGTLRKIADGYRPKKIVVVEHEGMGFEVRRLGNSDSVEMFYASIDATTPEQLPSDETERAAKVLNIIKDFLIEDVKKLATYDTRGLELRNAGCISEAYVSRRLSAVSVFRRAKEGATLAIKAALDEMENQGVLRKLTKEETEELFNSTAVIYRMNRQSLV